MAECHGNDIGSLVLNRATSTTTSDPKSFASFNLRKSFSAAAIRCKLLAATGCGGGGGGGSSISLRHHRESSSSKIPSEKTTREQGDARPLRQCAARSEKLCDLLNLAEINEKRENEAETRKKVGALEKLKRVVEELQCDDCDDGERRKIAAVDVRSMAKDSVEARAALVKLGAIPPLVGMLDCEDPHSQISALYALLNLGIGNEINKAAVVKAGAVHKMLKLVKTPPETMDPSISEAIAANFLGLSALDSNKPIIGSSGAIPFLVDVLLDLNSWSSPQATQDALRAIYNLSIFPLNVAFMLETDLVPFLVNALGDMELSERILSILSNIVSTPEGRKAISAVHDAFTILIDVLNWNDAPGCQEKASYILMVMAHKGYGDRQAMIKAGIVSALLELTLLGSALAQKRASRMLEYLRVDKGKHVSESCGGNMDFAVSAPICRPSSTSMARAIREGMEEREEIMSDETRAVKQLVKQSLQNNMRRIARRANFSRVFVPLDHLKSLTVSSTSKSLPF